jgi:putative tryptophan/tyrosine transport system substrate-binding protein
VDVIVALYVPCALAAKQATRDIPIVIIAGDPVETGIVPSLARPGGNITGVSLMAAAANGKSVELFRDMLPSVRRVGVLGHATNPVYAKAMLDEVLLAGRPIGIETQPVVMVHGPDDLESAFLTMVREQADALVVQGSLAIKPLTDLAIKYRLPAASTLGGTAVAWPLAARAQQPGKLPTIGFLGATTPSAMGQWAAAFMQRLRELGWIEGRTIAIDVRWAEGRTERLIEIATEFVRIKVDVIVTHSAAPVFAAMQATSVIPIVFAVANDPLGSGLVASLARPGGNVTGLSNQATDLAGKRLELLREVLPGLRRPAIMANVDAPAAVLEMGEVQAAARALGVEAVTLEIRRAEDIAPAFDALKGRADALFVCADPLAVVHRIQINTLAQGARLPTIFGFREFVEAGGLMSYGPNFPDQFRRAADFVDKILRGAKPGDIPGSSSQRNSNSSSILKRRRRSGSRCR